MRASSLIVAVLTPGCDAIATVYGSGIEAAALEYLDEGALAIAGAAYPGSVPAPAFMVIAEADGTAGEALRIRDELREALSGGAVAVETPDPGGLWRWRDGVSFAVSARKGAKLAGPLPADIQNYTTYGAALMSQATSPDAAKAFLSYLASPQAKQAFTAAGIE